MNEWMITGIVLIVSGVLLLIVSQMITSIKMKKYLRGDA